MSFANPFRSPSFLRPRSRATLAGLVAILVVLAGATLPSLADAEIVANPSLNVERAGHTATTLADGRILIVGGENASGAVGEAELYDPVSRTFVPGPSLLEARTDHTATRLPDGRVLVVGGSHSGAALGSTELYDPAANAFVAGPSLKRARTGHSATTLADGRILIAGGDAQGTAEIYDSAAGSSALLSARLSTPRQAHGSVLLQSGQVLIAGGLALDGATALDSAELFDPASQSFSSLGSLLQVARSRPTLRVLPDGKVQIMGGNADSSIELFDPADGALRGWAHVLNDTNALSDILRAQTRGALVHPIDPDDALLQSQLTPPARELLDREDHSLTEIPQANETLVAGGVSGANQFLSSAVVVQSSGATVTTDKSDYPPGSVVDIFGTHWQAGETVLITIHEEPPAYLDFVYSVVADPSGGFINMSFSPTPSDVGRTFTVTAVGQSSGFVAQTTFTDGTLSIFALSQSPFSPNQASSAGVKDTTDITVKNQTSGNLTGVTVRIRVGTSIGGTQVRELTIGNLTKSASATVNWNGKDTALSFVAEGTYTARAFSPSTGENDAADDKQPIVVDNTNPTVTLNSPADNALVSGNITLDASPLDAGGDDSNIDKVEFWVNDVNQGSDIGPSGGWNRGFNTAMLADGDYRWFAKAFDKAGNNAVSALRTIRIRNQGYYTAVISPTSATTGNPVSYAITVTNTTTLTAVTMASVEVAIPAGAGTPSSVTVTATSSTNALLTWLVDSAPAGTMRVQRTGNQSQNVDVGGKVVITFNATATTSGAKVWTTTAFLNQNYTQPFILQGSQPTVTVQSNQAITVTQHAPANATYSTSFTVAATSSSGLGVAISTTGVCSGSGTSSAPITMTSGTGTCTVHYNQGGDASYNAAPEVTESTAAQKASQAISFAQPASPATYNSTFSVNPTTSSGLTVSVAPSGGCSISGNTVTMTSGTDTCTLTASQGGDPNYSAADNVVRTVAAQTATQAITFAQPASPATYNSTFSVNPTTSSGLTVSVAPSGGCSISGNTVTMTSGTGTCTLTASQDGNANYSAAANVVRTVAAQTASQTITFAQPASPATYNTSFTVSPTADSSLAVGVAASGVCSLAGNTVTMTSGTGTCTLTASQGGNANYSAAQVMRSVTAAKATQTINFGTLADKYPCDASFTVSATGGASANAVTFSIVSGPATISGSVVTLTGMTGTVTVRASEAGNDDYGAAPEVDRTFNVGQLGFYGFLPPLGGADAAGGSYADTVRTFKLGSTIPVKFTASCNGAAVLTGIHTLQAVKYSNATDSDTPIDATPTDAATAGNQFRLTDGEWHFNINTKAGAGFSQGTWKLTATLADGSHHYVWITIKK